MKLIKLDQTYKNQLFNMMEEWISTNEKIVPWTINRYDYKDFENYLLSLENGFLPIKDSTFFYMMI